MKRLTRVDTNTEFAIATVRRVYGFEAAAERLPGEYDDNFLMTSGTGARTVLKIAHPDRDRAFIDMQCAALQHLARRIANILVPEVICTMTSEPVTVALDPDGRERLVWMLRYIEGLPLSQTSPQNSHLRRSLGTYVGRVDAALADFDHPAAHRNLKWDSANANWILAEIQEIRDPAKRRLVEHFMRLYEAIVKPALPKVRRSVIHGDANESNTLTSVRACELPEVLSVIDYGDMHLTITVSGLTTACAYAIFGQSDPIAAAADVVAGYHHALPIQPEEFALLFPLIAARLCVSVVNSAIRSNLTPDDPYLTISEAPAWEILDRFASVSIKLAQARFRAACGLGERPSA